MSEEFHTIWIERLQHPESRDQAARVIVEHFADQLLAMVRQRLANRFAGRIDPEDVLQSVFRSFFRCSFSIADSRGLFSLLVQLCVNKTRETVRFHQREKRDVRREDVAYFPTSTTRLGHPIEKLRATSEPTNLPTEQGPVESAIDDETLCLMAMGATAEQAACFFELVTAIPEELQPYLQLRIEGLTESEIAGRLGVTRRTVTRKLGRIYEHLRQTSR